MEHNEMVKRVINGKAYNTDTSELIARSAGSDDIKIYRTRGGAYFETVRKSETGDVDLTPLSVEAVRNRIAPASDDASVEYQTVGNVSDITSAPAAPTTAADREDQQSSAIFFRVSNVFKASIDEAAKKAGISVNAWLLRAVEQAIYPPLEQESLLWQIESTSEFRSRKAIEFPHDTRNAQSAEALKELYDYVARLPRDHPLFIALSLPPASDVTCEEFNRTQSSLLSRYGFDGPDSPESLIDDLKEAALKCAIDIE